MVDRPRVIAVVRPSARPPETDAGPGRRWVKEGATRVTGAGVCRPRTQPHRAAINENELSLREAWGRRTTTVADDELVVAGVSRGPHPPPRVTSVYVTSIGCEAARGAEPCEKLNER